MTPPIHNFGCRDQGGAYLDGVVASRGLVEGEEQSGSICIALTWGGCGPPNIIAAPEAGSEVTEGEEGSDETTEMACIQGARVRLWCCGA